MKHFIKITLPVLIIMLLLCEALLWLAPVPDPYETLKTYPKTSYIPSQFQPKTTLRLKSNEGLPGIDTAMTFSTNNYGFRGKDIKAIKDTNDYRVFLVGGSTTECIYIDDKKSNNHLLETLLNEQNDGQNYEVFNAGKSGDITVDHVAILAHKIVHLKPDCVVLFSGINDFRRNTYDYTQQGSFYSEKIPIPYIKFFLTNFQLFRRAYNIVKKPSIEAISLDSDYKIKVNSTASLPLSGTPPTLNVAGFMANLRSIIGICKANGIDLILVTQATTWDTKDDKTFTELNWLNFIGEFRYPETIMKENMEKYNDITRQLAKELGVKLLDLSETIKASREYFYDDCHFNNNGALFYATNLVGLVQNKTSK